MSTSLHAIAAIDFRLMGQLPAAISAVTMYKSLAAGFAADTDGRLPPDASQIAAHFRAVAATAGHWSLLDCLRQLIACLPDCWLYVIIIIFMHYASQRQRHFRMSIAPRSRLRRHVTPPPAPVNRLHEIINYSRLGLPSLHRRGHGPTISLPTMPGYANSRRSPPTTHRQ